MMQAIKLRKSIRKYKDVDVSPEHLQNIKTIINGAKHLFNNIPMEVLLIEDGSKITDTFKGLISKYTKVKAPHYLAFTSEIQEGHLENIGFIGEEIVLMLTELGIGTCWLGSAIKQDLFKTIFTVKENQNYIILIAFGYPLEPLKPVTTRKRFDKSKIITGALDTQYETIVQSIIDAPSAINSQPWKLAINNNKFDLFLENKNILTKKILKDTNHIDIGIGLSHLYNSAIELGYKIELKKASHKDMGNSEYIISAILNKN
ncbi:nitroreductase family protein [Clostridium frigoris]|uniref:Nitroreductase family protein n=1 Tax=Clostridium frigoris TaxID=205327 RepID=A0ABS6BXS2_9CLOT|nr:nitroreductase family protein [Clostridium frigoris]MBU3161403.1 nitroreductase family protein [Clostridium frigoris]